MKSQDDAVIIIQKAIKRYLFRMFWISYHYKKQIEIITDTKALKTDLMINTRTGELSTDIKSGNPLEYSDKFNMLIKKGELTYLFTFDNRRLEKLSYMGSVINAQNKSTDTGILFVNIISDYVYEYISHRYSNKNIYIGNLNDFILWFNETQ